MHEVCDTSCIKEEFEGDSTVLVEVSLGKFHILDYHFIFTNSWPLPRSSYVVSFGHLWLVCCRYLLGQIRPLSSLDCTSPGWITKQ